MNGLTPDITAVSVVSHGTLELTFADGLSGEVDVLDRMRGPVFEDARTPEGFGSLKALGGLEDLHVVSGAVRVQPDQPATCCGLR